MYRGMYSSRQQRWYFCTEYSAVVVVGTTAARQDMSLPSLDHFHFREYDHFYEPAEDTYLLIDALRADADFLRDSVRPSLCLEIGYDL